MISLNKGGEKMKYIGAFLVLFLIVMSVDALDFNLQKQDSGIVSGLEGKMLSLSVDGNSEIKMQIDRVGSQRIMMTLSSTQEVIVLDMGQEKLVDLDGDGTDDVTITLNNVIDKLASLNIQKIEAVVNDEDANVDEAIVDTGDEGLEEVTGDVVADTGAGLNLGQYSKWFLGAIIIVVLIIIVAFVYQGGDNSERYYGKAMDLHREGQEFHWDGDDETAEELYDKASELREKARNLEGGF